MNPHLVNSYYDEARCFDFVEQEYNKFLLFVFEKKVYTNYVSERFFKAMKYDMVPVVFPAFDNEKDVPKSSFIDAFKYTSVRKLVEYILFCT